MKIFTLTLSPAFDVHARTEQFRAGHENLVTELSREAGGKGVNISRALNVYPAKNTAVILLGKDNAAQFRTALQSAGLSCRFLEVGGRIRENLTIHCADAAETRISFPGFAADDGVLELIRNELTVDSDTVITVTGRLTDGIPMERMERFLLELKEKGARIVLDSRSFDNAAISRVKPWLIKPNQEEITAFLGKEISTVAQAAREAREFTRRGIENVIVSMGGQGAVLLTKDAAYTAIPPEISAVSTIGAGDSMIAGFLGAYAEGKAPGDCLKSAVAFGTAACLQEGTKPPLRADIDRILGSICIEKNG